MLLNGYHLQIFNNECMPGALTVQCFAHLDQDVGKDQNDCPQLDDEKNAKLAAYFEPFFNR